MSCGVNHPFFSLITLFVVRLIASFGAEARSCGIGASVRLEPSGEFGGLLDGALRIEFGSQVSAADDVHRISPFG